MELPVRLQLQELGWALALGAALALVYELLRPLRRGRSLTAAADLVYGLAVLIALLGFSLYAGRGRLRLFALAGMALSGGLCLRLGAQFRRIMKKIAKKAKKRLHLPENLLQ